MKYGLIGETLGHSFSPVIHNRIGDYPYELCELSRDALDSFMKKREFAGINVTIPYKKAVLPYLNEISEEAKAIGAVNTVVNKDGRLYGYNTDFAGLKALLLRITGGKRLGGKALVLGTGGTSLTAVAALTALGATDVIRVSRQGKDGACTYEEASRLHRDAVFLCNCTPCGMFPSDKQMPPLSLDDFPALIGVADAIYNPLRTLLVKEAQKRGIKAEGGLYMLVAQAVHAAELFLDKPLSPRLTDTIHASLLRDKENVVLIGMPASGKSSVGQALAKRLGKPFYDIDTEIVKTAGRDIPTLFQTVGESGFREIEAEVTAVLAARAEGAVIATGGGTVLRRDNVDALKANGRLFFLDRPLSLLIPTDDRPLSSDKESLTRRYNERYPLYCEVCDERIVSEGTVEETTDALWRLITKEPGL